VFSCIATRSVRQRAVCHRREAQFWEEIWFPVNSFRHAEMGGERPGVNRNPGRNCAEVGGLCRGKWIFRLPPSSFLSSYRRARRAIGVAVTPAGARARDTSQYGPVHD